MSIQPKEIAKLAAEALEPTGAMKRFRHKKTDGTYGLVGIGRMQTEDWETRRRGLALAPVSVDMREVAIYRSEKDGLLWARPREEFEDGRFEEIAAPAISTETGQGFSVPGGYKLVPVEPSEAMLEALRHEAAVNGYHSRGGPLCYAAILAAAPAIDIPAPAGGEEAVACPGYMPDYQAMGDCLNCGHMERDHVGDPFAHPAPDHHLRVEVETCSDCGSALNGDGECTRDIAEREADDLAAAEARATTAETRIAELEAAAEPVAKILGSAEWASPEHAQEILRELIDGHYASLRSALASSNKPVEEGR